MTTTDREMLLKVFDALKRHTDDHNDMRSNNVRWWHERLRKHLEEVPSPAPTQSPSWEDVRRLIAKAVRLGRMEPQTPATRIVDEVIAEGLP